MDELRIFKNSSFGVIRTAGTSEEPLFCLTDVCKALGLDARHVRERLDDGVVSTDIISDALGRRQEANFVNEDGLYDVILDSRKPQARAFRKWITHDIIPSIRRTGSYSVPTVPQQPAAPQPTLTDKIKTAKFLASFLRLNDTSRLALAKAIADPLGLPTPDYAKSKGVMHSATELLQRLGYKVTATAFNKLAAAKGFVSQMSRPGSKGNTHTWYAITDKGKTFGENVVSPKNAKQTQAHWYDDKFDELCALVGIRKEVAA